VETVDKTEKNKALGCQHVKIHPIVELIKDHEAYEVLDLAMGVIVIEQGIVKVVCWKCWSMILTHRATMLKAPN